jgi:hypothetical protein
MVISIDENGLTRSESNEDNEITLLINVSPDGNQIKIKKKDLQKIYYL